MQNNIETNLKNYSYIENTRMIYKLMTEIKKKINNEPETYTGDGGLKKRSSIIKQIKEEIEMMFDDCYKDDIILYQNTLSNYILFWEKYFEEKVSDNLFEIANAYNYFRQINDVYDSKFLYDDLPYIFEDICFSICEMVKAKMCYFAYKESNGVQSVITQSGYFYNKNSVDFDDPFSNDEEKNDFIEGIKWSNKGYIYISMPLHLKPMNYDKEFQIIIFKDTEIDIQYLKMVVSRIMFMREKLFVVIERLFAVLIKLKGDYEYIKPINPVKEISLLHMSDLHVTLNKKWSTDSKNIMEIEKTLEKEISGIADLIVITGDVIQAATNAEEAQKRYQLVEKIIACFAKACWGVKIYEDIYLPHDWKKRIIITTGNHDYAAMNDVVVQTQSRVIKSAIPSKDSGGTMSKFTYLLEFLQRFLNLPIENLIKDDLNEIRILRNFKLNLFVLNSVSLANSMQNNKVGFNKNIINKIVRKCKDNNQNKSILLSHHSPTYKINYFEDIYNPYSLFDINEDTIVKRLYDIFSNIVSTGGKKDIFNSSDTKELNDTLKKFDEIIEKYQKTEAIDGDIKKIVEKQYDIPSARKKEVDNWISDFCQSDLYFDIKHLCNYTTNGITNEFSTDLYNKLKNMNNLCKRDINDMNEIYKDIFKNIKVIAVLSGHEHKQSELRYKDKPVYIADKLENNFYLITIGEKGRISRIEYNS